MRRCIINGDEIQSWMSRKVRDSSKELCKFIPTVLRQLDREGMNQVMIKVEADADDTIINTSPKTSAVFIRYHMYYQTGCDITN